MIGPVDWKPSLYVDIPDGTEIPEDLKAGQTVTFTVTGKLKSFTDRDSEEQSSRSMDVEIRKIEFPKEKPATLTGYLRVKHEKQRGLR